MPWYVNTYNNNYALPPKFNRLSSHIIMLLVLGESQVSNFVLERKKKKRLNHLVPGILHQKWSNVISSEDTQPNATQHKLDLSFLLF